MHHPSHPPSHQGICPDVVTYSTAAAAAEWLWAVQLLRNMCQQRKGLLAAGSAVNMTWNERNLGIIDPNWVRVVKWICLFSWFWILDLYFASNLLTVRPKKKELNYPIENLSNRKNLLNRRYLLPSGSSKQMRAKSRTFCKAIFPHA